MEIKERAQSEVERVVAAGLGWRRIEVEMV